MTADNDHDTYDPRIAERFAELDRLEPPELFAQAAAGPRATGPVPPRRQTVDTWVLGAAAATIALLGLFGVFVGVWGGDDGDNVAADGTAADLGDSTAEIDLDEEASGEASGEDDGGVDGVEAIPSTSAGSGSAGAGDTTTTTEAAPTTTEQTPPPTSGTTAVTEETGPPSTEAGSAVLQIIGGTVTEVFTDCYQHLVLDEYGEIDDSGPVSCDGGSWVIIDGIRIGTASGLVLSDDDVYDHHIRDLMPGEEATAVAMATENGALNLNCDRCSLERGLPFVVN